MVRKIQADELREMDTQDIQRVITDMQAEKMKVLSSEMGAGKPVNADQSIGTIKRNIARAKTIINEKMPREYLCRLWLGRKT